MIRIFDIAFKDLLQLSRDFKTFMFLLIMPIVFTFSSAMPSADLAATTSTRACPSVISRRMTTGSRTNFTICWQNSEVIRLEDNVFLSSADLEKLVADGDLAAAVIVPDGYGRAVLKNKTVRLTVIRGHRHPGLDDDRSGASQPHQPRGWRSPHGNHHGGDEVGRRARSIMPSSRQSPHGMSRRSRSTKHPACTSKRQATGTARWRTRRRG